MRYNPSPAFASIFTALTASLTLGCASAAGAVQDTPITADDLRADLEDWMGWTTDTHPQLSWSVDPADLDAAVARTNAEITTDYGHRSAWFVLAQLNPVLNDAHLGVRLPDAAFNAYREAGGAAFTAPVEIREGRIFVADSIAAHAQLQAGDEFLAINGMSAETLIASLQPLMRGESDELRERVLSLRFDVALWTLLGDQHDFTVDLNRDGERMGGLRLDPTRDHVGASAAPFALHFKTGAAIMTVDSFDAALEDSFADFLAASFAEIADSGADQLILDLRANGGGARQLSDRLMAYLTAERYTAISAVTARITPENQALVPGSQIGQVIATPFAQWVEPPAALTHRFTGSTTILIGSATYSQAIVFAATARDFGLASLAGQPTAAPANQSGQVQRFTLPNSGLVVQSPIYVFTRASGETGRAPLTPDVMLEGDADAQLDALLALER